MVDVRCPDCGHASQIEYRRLGSVTRCSGCQTSTAPSVPIGGSYPLTGWELNFSDFLMLVRDRESRSRIEPLLQAWFHYQLVGTGTDTRLCNSQNQLLDPLTVHLAIQDDPAQQLALYQTAMPLWR